MTAAPSPEDDANLGLNLIVPSADELASLGFANAGGGTKKTKRGKRRTKYDRRRERGRLAKLAREEKRRKQPKRCDGDDEHGKVISSRKIDNNDKLAELDGAPAVEPTAPQNDLLQMDVATKTNIANETTSSSSDTKIMARKSATMPSNKKEVDGSTGEQYDVQETTAEDAKSIHFLPSVSRQQIGSSLQLMKTGQQQSLSNEDTTISSRRRHGVSSYSTTHLILCSYHVHNKFCSLHYFIINMSPQTLAPSYFHRHRHH